MTVERILTAAAQVLAEEGLAATTDRIAVRAGVSVGALYRYFPNKDALVVELARRQEAEATDLIGDVLRPGRPSVEWLPELVSAVAHLHQDRDLHRVLHGHAAGATELAETFEQLNRSLRGRVEELLIAEGQHAHPATTALVLVAMVESLTPRLAGVVDQVTLVRELSRAAAAYLDAVSTVQSPDRPHA